MSVFIFTPAKLVGSVYFYTSIGKSIGNQMQYDYTTSAGDVAVKSLGLDRYEVYFRSRTHIIKTRAPALYVIAEEGIREIYKKLGTPIPTMPQPTGISSMVTGLLMSPAWHGGAWSGMVKVNNQGGNWNILGLQGNDPFLAEFPVELSWDPTIEFFLIFIRGALIGFHMDGEAYLAGTKQDQTMLPLPKPGARRVWDKTSGGWAYKSDDSPTACTSEMVPSMTKHEWSGFCKSCKSSSNHAQTHPRGLCYECSAR